MLSLNGFSSDPSSRVIQPGVTFIAHQTDDITKLTCQGMEFQTQYIGEPITVVKEDLVDDESIFVKETKNATGWKDLSMDSIVTRFSKAMDRMYSDETVKPIFTKTRSHVILGVSLLTVTIFVVVMVLCCCAQKFNQCMQCLKTVCCCRCLGTQRQELHFNQGHRMSTLERRSNQL